jgi:hypothetical protein
MPRYFFDIIDHKALIDNEGVELSGIGEAREMALRTAGEVLASEGKEFWETGKWRMKVSDENGTVRFTLDFSADTHTGD